jgi:microcompartment protein PduB
MAADEGIKATNTEILRVEMPRDTKGQAGHGNLIIFGAEDVSDARRAVEVTLEMLPKFFGDVYANSQGYTENQYSARASKVLNFALKVPEGRAFGLILGAPAVVGMLMVDAAVKAADVQVLGYGSPAHGTSLTNEVFVWVTGDSGAVRQAVIAGREVGNKLLNAWGEEPKSLGTPYI